jgi:alkylhydroperoxidase family enzyme
MLKRYFHRSIAKLERQFGYDASYFHEIVDISPAAAFKFFLAQAMAQHADGVPKEALYAARLAAALSEDCGPCVQLGVNMALADGMPREKIEAMLRGDIDEAGVDAALGFRYGMAVATNSVHVLAEVEQARLRFGERGLVTLAFAVASVRVYPTLKRALGHGAACTKIVVSDREIAVKRAA